MQNKYWPHDIPEPPQKISLLNEPAEEPKRESAAERAKRIWFKHEKRPRS
jgi:hypothetical protein